MSRFFYIKRDMKRRNIWRCEMSWRDNVYTFSPHTPERSPNLTSFLEAMRGGGLGGEVIKRLTQAQRVANETRSHYVEAMGHHVELMAQLEELRAIQDQENKAVEAVQEALRAQLATERAARATEEEAMRSELEAALNEKTAVEAKLEEAKSRAAEDAERLRGEVTNGWALGKEEFLKSPEFECLCVKKSVAYFRSGFEGCVAQFRANGYPEEEHPASFLDAKKALRDMPEDDEEAAEEEEEEE
ncbi:protein NETWORKED 1D [Dorcoceras hygrometricum]|uniref:Protein NETWORKED 1D n=1 Tax=Dorcoceras hygrometricum TaxID=472368 RepID=A0A2Z7A6D2_9LAMI|nr:protein NETWORKED 1D [Dorcoceras hygrometricum]